MFQSKIEMLKCIVCFIKIWVFCIWPISLKNLEISLKWMILENLLKISTKWQISKNHLNLPKSTIIFLFGFSKKKKNNTATTAADCSQILYFVSCCHNVTNKQTDFIFQVLVILKFKRAQVLNSPRCQSSLFIFLCVVLSQTQLFNGK